MDVCALPDLCRMHPLACSIEAHPPPEDEVGQRAGQWVAAVKWKAHGGVRCG